MPEMSESPVAEGGNATSEEKGRIEAKAEELKEQVTARAGSATRRVGQRIESVSQALRERAEGEGRLHDAAGMMANRLERVGTYLNEKDLGAMTDDLTAMIRRHPIRSMLVGMGVGYLVARLVSRKG